jgi:hypothetical protein
MLMAAGKQLPVMPAKAGIQPFVAAILDSRLRGKANYLTLFEFAAPLPTLIFLASL